MRGSRVLQASAFSVIGLGLLASTSTPAIADERAEKCLEDGAAAPPVTDFTLKARTSVSGRKVTTRSGRRATLEFELERPVCTIAYAPNRQGPRRGPRVDYFKDADGRRQSPIGTLTVRAIVNGRTRSISYDDVVTASLLDDGRRGRTDPNPVRPPAGRYICLATGPFSKDPCFGGDERVRYQRIGKNRSRLSAPLVADKNVVRVFKKLGVSLREGQTLGKVVLHEQRTRNES